LQAAGYSNKIKKCNEKIASDDYDGAITNARTLLEKGEVVKAKKYLNKYSLDAHQLYLDYPELEMHLEMLMAGLQETI